MTNTPHKIDLDRLKQAMPIMDLAKSLGLEIRERNKLKLKKYTKK